MKVKYKLLFVFILVVVLYIAISRSLYEAKPITEYETEVKDVIVSKQIELDKVKSLGDLVTLGQSFSKQYIDIDSNFFGERRTIFELNGTYQLGIDTKEIKFTPIDNHTIVVELPKTKIISLEIPYDKILIVDESGIFRKIMKNEDLKDLYIRIEDNFRDNLLKDEQIILQSRLYNEYAVEELILRMTAFKKVEFID